MGVKGLWALLEPVAKPQRIESLHGKILAIDASIWLHQFIKAMRDATTGNLLQAAHVVGFFRRICKLLFYHIKPVFVFDGGCPAIKRRTAFERKSRKSDSRISLQRTAEKLFQTRLKLHALDGVNNMNASLEEHHNFTIGKGSGSGNIAAAATTTTTTTSSSKSLIVRKSRDEYELFDSNNSTNTNINTATDYYYGGNHQDVRMPSEQELRDFIDMHVQEVTTAINSSYSTNPLSSIINTPEFSRLPIHVQHELILDAKLRSRKTSWENVDRLRSMAKSSAEFSQLQIQNLVGRNEMTERYSEFTKHAGVVINPLANKNKNKPSGRVETSRIASERSRQYVLIKNDVSSDQAGGYTMRLLQQQQQQQQISGVDGVTGFKIPTHKVSSSSGMPYLEEIFSGREYDKDDNDDNGSVVDLTRDDGDDDDVNIKKNISCVQTSETDQEIRNMGRMFLRHDQQEQQQQQQLKHSATFQDYDDHSDGRDSVRVIYDSDDDAEFIEVPTTPATTAAVAVGSSHHQKSNNTGSEDDSPLFLDEEEAMMMLIQQQQLEEEEKIKTANGVASGEGRGASDGGAFQGMYVDDAEDISVIMAKFHQQEKQAKLSSSSSTLLLPVSPLKQHQQQLPPLPAPSNSTSSYNHQHQHQQVYPPPPLSTFKKSSSSNTLPPAKSILPTSSLPIDDLLLNYTLLAPPEFISNFSTITNNPSTTNSINNDTTANNNSQEKALHSSILRDVVYSWSHQQIQDEVMRVKRRLEKMPIGAPEEQMNGWIFWMGFLEEVGKVLPSSSSDWTRGTSGSPKTKMKVIPTTSITGSSSSITPSKRRISSLLQFEDDDEEEEEEEEEEATKEEVAADISGPPVKRARTEDLSPLSETTSSPLVRGLPGSGSSSPAPTLPGPTFTVAATKHPLDLQQQLQKQSSGRPLPVSSPIESDTWHLAVAASPTSANEVRAAAPKEDFIDKSATSLLSTKNSSSPTRAPTTPSPKQHQYLSDQQPQQQQRLIKIPESAVLFDQNEVILVQDDYEVVIDQNRVPFGRVNRNQPISLDELDDDNFQDNPNNQKKFIIDNIADHELDGAVDVPIVLDDENEEFERFFSSLTAATADNTAAQGGGSLSFAANAAAVRGNLENEERELKIQKRREERDAADVSGDMIREVQELLQLFGIPYIVAPMEAEAQCAFLYSNGLVDGIVTDDSDVFLFGGSQVYKNMFNQSKFVELYSLEDLERELHLTRNLLIRMAYLLGSDYTEGVHGIGVVTAVEILNEWGSEDGLKDFKEFWKEANAEGAKKSRDQSKLRNKLKRLCGRIELMDTFPDPLIAQAYTAPQIDSSTQRFEWGLPDIDEIKYYMRDKSGWTAEKVDQIILPVVKEMANRAAPQQTTLDRFFHVQQPSPAKDKFKSIRMKTAIDKMGKVDEIKGSIIKSRSRGRGSGRGRGRGDHRGKGK